MSSCGQRTQDDATSVVEQARHPERNGTRHGTEHSRLRNGGHAPPHGDIAPRSSGNVE